MIFIAKYFPSSSWVAAPYLFLTLTRITSPKAPFPKGMMNSKSSGVILPPGFCSLFFEYRVTVSDFSKSKIACFLSSTA